MHIEIKELELAKNYQLYVNAPIYWWLEFYALGLVHHDLSDFILRVRFEFHELNEELKNLPVFPNGDDIGWIANDIQTFCTEIIKRYEETMDEHYLQAFKQLVPSGYNFTNVIYLSYDDIRMIYHCFKHDNSNEWKEFIKKIEDFINE